MSDTTFRKMKSTYYMVTFCKVLAASVNVELYQFHGPQVCDFKCIQIFDISNSYIPIMRDLADI